MVITPYWSAFTNAYEKYDLKWIKIVKKDFYLRGYFFALLQSFFTLFQTL